MAIKFANFAEAKIASPPSGTSGLSFAVATGKGALFPTFSGGDIAYGIFVNAARSAFEVVKIEGRSGDGFTIATGGRGQDGTTAQTWTTADYFYTSAPRVLLELIFGTSVDNPILAELASVANGKGAARVGIEDAAGNYASTTVEAAFAEIWTKLASTVSTIGAALIGFIQAGADAVGRTLLAKARERVTLEDFGGGPAASATVNSAAAERALASGARLVSLVTPGVWQFKTDVARTCTNNGLSEAIRCAFMPRPDQEIVIGAGVDATIEDWVSEGGSGPGHLFMFLKAYGAKLTIHGKCTGNYVSGEEQPGRSVLSSQHLVHVASSNDVTITLHGGEMRGAWTDAITVSYYGNSATFHNSKNVNIKGHGYIHDNQRMDVSGVGWKGGRVEAVCKSSGLGASPFAGVDLEPNAVSDLSDGNAVCEDIILDIYSEGHKIGVLMTCAEGGRINRCHIAPTSIIKDGVDLHTARYGVTRGTIDRMEDDPDTSAPVSAIRLRDSHWMNTKPDMISYARKHGIEEDEDCTNNTFAPEMIVNVSQETTDTYNGMEIGGQHGSIKTGTIRMGDGAAVARYGIHIAESAVDTKVWLNDLTNAGNDGDLEDDGSDTQYFGGGETQTRMRIGANTELMYMQLPVPLGGGAVPTLGTIGATGPATAAQSGWKREIGADGDPRWVPFWK